MTAIFILITVLGLLGAFDNFYNHEWKVGLARRESAVTELWLHAARQWMYAILFAGLAWFHWYGWLAFGLMAVMVIEVLITLWDFVEEDRTRALSPQERVTHTLLTLFYGVVLGLLVPVLWQWSTLPTALVAVQYGVFSWILSVYAVGVVLWGTREAVAAYTLQHPNPRQTFILSK